MICYKDKTFCDTDCKPKEFCSKQYTKKIQADANKWWGKEGAPVMVADFSKDCNLYIKDK